MINSKNPVYWLLKIKNPTHQIDENLGLNPGWFFWFSSLTATVYTFRDQINNDLLFEIT